MSWLAFAIFIAIAVGFCLWAYNDNRDDLP